MNNTPDSTHSPFKYGIKKALASWRLLCMLGLLYLAIFIISLLLNTVLAGMIGYPVYLRTNNLSLGIFVLGAALMNGLIIYSGLYVLYQSMWNIHSDKKINLWNFWQPSKIVNLVVGSLLLATPLYALQGFSFFIVRHSHAFNKSYAWLGILSILFLALVAGIVIPRFLFWYVYVVAENYSAFAAYKASWKLTSHHILSTYVLCIKFLLLQCLGYLAFGIGFLLTYPAGILAYMYVWSRWTGTSLYTPQVSSQSPLYLTQP
ncbi:hypothetical protein J120_00055 [candidate division TM6 bacterium JCVI TM6SC1]|uniref:DUF7847 domain-containing protein n=1 Tax=candidate division TM6 bacterium JCVI TM6SC1 TaxID=1306947 RepID=A0A0D2I2G0_9BACT|nr:hypothetical protein J120_00055 [candidate division TM6 bacterium JCVI TM6SC1]